MLKERNNHFKPIPGFPDYLIHCSGKIIFLPMNEIINKQSYLAKREVSLIKDGIIKNFNINRLINIVFKTKNVDSKKRLYGRMI